MNDAARTVTVPHLGTSSIGHRFSRPYDSSRPTLVMVNSFTTSVELYRPQFAHAELAQTANLLAIEPYGHGETRSPYEHFTYWDTAHANLQLLDALGISEAFVLGTSQGGWVAARMAMFRHGEGHHAARDLHGRREPAQPRPRVLGRRRVLHPSRRRTRRHRRC